MCQKCVHRLINAIVKSLVMVEWNHIIKNKNKRSNRKFCIFLFIFYGAAHHFVAVRKILSIQGHCTSSRLSESLYDINMYAVDGP